MIAQNFGLSGTALSQKLSEMIWNKGDGRELDSGSGEKQF